MRTRARLYLETAARHDTRFLSWDTQTVPPHHPSFLIFTEMTGKERRRGVRVSTLCLVGNAVCVVRSNSPPSQRLGRLQRCSHGGVPLRGGEIDVLLPRWLSFPDLPSGLAESSGRRLILLQGGNWGRSGATYMFCCCPGEVPSWAKRTSEKAVGPISHRNVLQRIHQRSLPAAEGVSGPCQPDK